MGPYNGNRLLSLFVINSSRSLCVSGSLNLPPSPSLSLSASLRPLSLPPSFYSRPVDLLEPSVESKQVRHCVEVQSYLRKPSKDVHTSGSAGVWERQRDGHRNTTPRKEKETNRERSIVGRETQTLWHRWFTFLSLMDVSTFYHNLIWLLSAYLQRRYMYTL